MLSRRRSPAWRTDAPVQGVQGADHAVGVLPCVPAEAAVAASRPGRSATCLARPLRAEERQGKK
eukprot:5655325-Pyramimonas_sp.AAC.1